MRSLASIALALTIVAAAPAAGQTQSIGQMTTRVNNDFCTAGWKQPDGTSFTIAYGIEDGFVNVNIDRPRWEMVDDKDTDENDHSIDIVFADGSKTSSAVGGFKSGFTEGVWGNWKTDRKGAGSASQFWSDLKNNSSLTASIDGIALGSFELSTMKGFAANYLEKCAADELAKR